MTRAFRPSRAVALFVVVAVTACGGGGGSSSSAPPPSNPPPPPPAANEPVRFEKAAGIGLEREFDALVENMTPDQRYAGGVAAADFDADGDVDLYVAGGLTEPNHLFENQGNGTFVDVAQNLGVDVTHWGSGPAWGDIDADGDLDLFVGSVEHNQTYLFENRLDEAEARFVDVFATSGLQNITVQNTVSATFYDYDGDGFIDLFFAHWGTPAHLATDSETIWRNNGDGTFSGVSIPAGVVDGIFNSGTDFSYSPTLSDIDGDGDGDLLMTSDFNTSEVFVNNGDGTFTRTTDRTVIKDRNGMGTAVADYDNDGDMDWFVTSISEQGQVGNRLYRNDGGGVFDDVTDQAGVDIGFWGWGACAADFDHDGYLDIFHVNGWVGDQTTDWSTDPIRFFHNDGEADMSFTERAPNVGLIDNGQGRGVACFDGDRDGDIDILIVNSSAEHLVYFRNTTDDLGHYLGIKLQGAGTNNRAIGAHITVIAGGMTQVRELGGRNNFTSHDPYEVHFGLADATQADVTVRWPDGATETMTDVAADQLLTIVQQTSNLTLVVSQGSGGGVYEVGDDVPIQALVAPEGYYFSHWTSSNGGAFADEYAESTTFTMPGGTVTVSANYVPGVSPTADVSVARRWNEVVLQAIRNDYARPTVHARNLFHTSVAMFDSWAAHDSVAVPWLLGRTRAGETCVQGPLVVPADAAEIEAARAEAMSYAVYRIVLHRFVNSPGVSQILADANALMGYLGYDTSDTSTDYSGGSASGLGNHIAQCIIDFGLADGANEANDYANQVYLPVNGPLQPELPGNPNISDLNRWQPLELVEFIDQAGNPVSSTPEFLSPEWGQVVPFALTEADVTRLQRPGETYEYWVYHDPGSPPTIDGALGDNYKWGHSLVAIWSAHLDPTVGRGADLIDISPASIGNIPDNVYPTQFEDHPNFYDTLDGGDASQGHASNPVTGLPYDPQLVPLGDYARVLAEFWADGPDSETPPGHWFVIINEVNEHPDLVRQFRGAGPVLGHLEWDVKSYFLMGGTMHDAAITAWGIKGWYDYIRPVSAIRAMADLGQSSDAGGDSYHPDGIILEPGFIEVVQAGDPLEGASGEHVGKVKLFAWRGPDYIVDPETDVAGVGWILAENWWPYQRPSFVTPPFAGYVSGHSTYSRAAAEVMTALTGDPFFPGGKSGFEITANEFLVFEEGPSVDMTLEWATYRDASDQTSLSRIWGGIHPPADDIPGRLIGRQIGMDAFALGESYFDGTAP